VFLYTVIWTAFRQQQFEQELMDHGNSACSRRDLPLVSFSPLRPYNRWSRHFLTVSAKSPPSSRDSLDAGETQQSTMHRTSIANVALDVIPR
jgi:adenine-specific DNA glycosylase